MTSDISQALIVISILSLACVILSPILWWILPDRTHESNGAV